MIKKVTYNQVIQMEYNGFGGKLGPSWSNVLLSLRINLQVPEDKEAHFERKIS